MVNVNDISHLIDLAEIAIQEGDYQKARIRFEEAERSMDESLYRQGLVRTSDDPRARILEQFYQRAIQGYQQINQETEIL